MTITQEQVVEVAKDMPCVTVEQVLRLRDYAISLEAELAALREANKKLQAFHDGVMNTQPAEILNHYGTWVEYIIKPTEGVKL